jgi:multidrug resistance efflux pump
MARKYKNVRGTNDFLIAAIGLTLLGLWAVRDGWFPTPKTLEKHPLMAEVEFEDAGQIEEVLVDTGMAVSSNSPIARLTIKNIESKQERAEMRLAEAENELRKLEVAAATTADNAVDYEGRIDQKKEDVKAIRRELAGIKQDLMRNIIRTDHKGKVREIRINAGDSVEAGDVAAVINVKDHYYTFIKSLAIGSLLGALICAFFHLKLK